MKEKMIQPYISLYDLIPIYKKLLKLKKSNYPIKKIDKIIKQDLEKADIKFL